MGSKISFYLENRKHLKWSPEKLKSLQKEALNSIFYDAFKAIKNVNHFTKPEIQFYEHFGKDGELDLDLTLEENPEFFKSGYLKGVWLKTFSQKKFRITVIIDMSLSMSGKKIYQTAVALTILSLHFPESEISIVGFQNQAFIIKEFFEKISIDKMLLKFLGSPSDGFTNIEEGLKLALRINQSKGNLKKVSVMMTDGKYTEGKNPIYLAKKFRKLHVIQMGYDSDHRKICYHLSRMGNGNLYKSLEVNHLPEVMYRFVKDLGRE